MAMSAFSYKEDWLEDQIRYDIEMLIAHETLKLELHAKYGKKPKRDYTEDVKQAQVRMWVGDRLYVKPAGGHEA